MVCVCFDVWFGLVDGGFYLDGWICFGWFRVGCCGLVLFWFCCVLWICLVVLIYGFGVACLSW